MHFISFKTVLDGHVVENVILYIGQLIKMHKMYSFVVFKKNIKKTKTTKTKQKMSGNHKFVHSLHPLS
jgi:hypothetical protein